MDYNLPDSSLHGILRARVLEWVAISFSNGLSITCSLLCSPTTNTPCLTQTHKDPESDTVARGAFRTLPHPLQFTHAPLTSVHASPTIFDLAALPLAMHILALSEVAGAMEAWFLRAFNTRRTYPMWEPGQELPSYENDSKSAWRAGPGTRKPLSLSWVSWSGHL